MKKYFLITALTTVFFADCGAQQYPVFSQYYFNELVINPAYAGSHVKLSATAMYRNQWVNFAGAPKTYNFSSHTSLLKNKIGVGIMFNHDEIGSYRNNHVYGYYAYKLHFPDATLSMGLQAGFNLVDADFSALDLQNPDDVSFQDLTSEFKPNLAPDSTTTKTIISSAFPCHSSSITNWLIPSKHWQARSAKRVITLSAAV